MLCARAQILQVLANFQTLVWTPIKQWTRGLGWGYKVYLLLNQNLKKIVAQFPTLEIYAH